MATSYTQRTKPTDTSYLGRGASEAFLLQPNGFRILLAQGGFLLIDDDVQPIETMYTNRAVI